MGIYQQGLSLLLLFVLLYPALSAEHCHPEDLKALSNINKAFGNLFTSWSLKYRPDCCKWPGVRCHYKNRVTDVFIDYDNDVTGHIPDAFVELRYLQFIRFSGLPNLTGPIPQAFSRLKHLNYLWIYHCNISGPIPDFLGQLTNLTYINLSVNQLTGPLPPSLSNLHQLTYLDVERNQLSGSIPASFSEFSKGFYLKLSKNQLSGPIPQSLGAVDFEVLQLSRNNFSGDASFFFGANKSLQSADLSRNQLSFDLTKVVFPANETLGYVDLSHNHIYGAIPPSLANINFNVSYNKLCGPIPTGGSLSEYEYAHNKCLCGSPLPPCK